MYMLYITWQLILLIYYFLMNYFCKNIRFYCISAIKSIKIELNKNVLIYFIKLRGTHT